MLLGQAALAVGAILVVGQNLALAAVRPPHPPSCRAAIAEPGTAGLWYGQYAGVYDDAFRDVPRYFSAGGCFASKEACTLWRNKVRYLVVHQVSVDRCVPYENR
ncbi:MAG: hypothetical protein AAF638_05370 [Pseudomonadota bacterium]